MLNYPYVSELLRGETFCTYSSMYKKCAGFLQMPTLLSCCCLLTNLDSSHHFRNDQREVTWFTFSPISHWAELLRVSISWFQFSTSTSFIYLKWSKMNMLHFEGALFASGKFLCRSPWDAFAMSLKIFFMFTMLPSWNIPP